MKQFIRNVRNGLRNLLGKPPVEHETETVVDHQTSRQLERIEEDVKRGRGEAEAKAAELERDYEQLQEQVEDGRGAEVPEYLQNQQEQLRDEDWVGGVSLLAVANKIQDPEDDIRITSYEEKQDFGWLSDIHISQKGTIALINEEGDRIVSGNDFSKLAASPGGLRNQVNNGYWRAPVTKDKKPVAPPETATVPTMMEIDGDIVQLSNTRENYVEKMAEYRQQIGQLQQEKESLEKQLEKVTKVAQQESLEKKIASESLDKERTMSEKHVEEAIRAKAQFDAMQNKLSRTTSDAQMKEDLVKDMWAEKEQWNRVFAEQFDDEELDVLEDKWHQIATAMVQNFDQLADVSKREAEAQKEANQAEGGQNQQPPQGQQGR